MATIPCSTPQLLLTILLVVGGGMVANAIGFRVAPTAGRYYDTIEQRLDNFDTQNNATFKQRYFVRDVDYEGGPFYVLISNGLLERYSSNVHQYLINEAVQRERGLLAVIEPRFYGKSVPNDDLSLATLRFLNVDQTLADVAHFVAHLRRRYGDARAPVVVLGSDMAGSLAVWFRQRYPHLSAGVWGHWARLQARQDNGQYNVNNDETLRRIVGDECYAVIEAGCHGLEALSRRNELTELAEVLRLCEPLQPGNRTEKWNVFYSLTRFFPLQMPYTKSLRDGCVQMVRSNRTHGATRAVAGFVQMNYGGCIGTRRTSDMEELRDETPSGGDLRQELYQACTQLGWFPTTSPGALFETELPLEAFSDLCRSVFGTAAEPALALANERRFNEAHGGIRPLVTNALFTDDRWNAGRTLGVTGDLSETAVAIVVDEDVFGENGSGLFYAKRDEDNEGRRQQKRQIVERIRSWTKY